MGVVAGGMRIGADRPVVASPTVGLSCVGEQGTGSHGYPGCQRDLASLQDPSGGPRLLVASACSPAQGLLLFPASRSHSVYWSYWDFSR